MLIRDNGRSADFMAPAFGFGCLFKNIWMFINKSLYLLKITLWKNGETLKDLKVCIKFLIMVE